MLRRVAESSDGELTQRMIDDVIAHTRVQFSATTEEESAHVDAGRLATLDGLAIDRGTPMQDAGTIDTEDCAVLFELNRLKIGSDATSFFIVEDQLSRSQLSLMSENRPLIVI